MRAVAAIFVLVSVSYGIWSFDEVLMLGRRRMATVMRTLPAVAHL